MADSIGCTSTIRDMHLTGTMATIDMRERVEWSIKFPADMPKVSETSPSGPADTLEHDRDPPTAKDAWVQTPRGWLLGNRMVTTHHLAAHQDD